MMGGRLWLTGALMAAGVTLAPSPVAVAAGICAASSEAPRSTFAIIIGANVGPKSEKLVELNYADDDAVRFYRFIKIMRPDAVAFLLARPDPAIWQRFPEATSWRTQGRIRTPTMQDLRDALADLANRAAADVAAGRGVDFYFVFAGHGGVLDDGRGGLYLEDGVFSRKDLHEQVIRAFPRVDKHLILDACHAERAASSRGANERLERLRDLEDIRHQPNAGLLAASNPTGRVKEWERYRGGIFSHEVLAGLLGGADVDGDDCVTYRELVGFLRAANDGIHVDAAKLAVMSSPPYGDKDFVIADWRGTKQPRFTVPPAATGHVWIEDQQLERWFETNRPSGQPVKVVLPSSPPHYLRSAAPLVLSAPPAPLDGGTPSGPRAATCFTVTGVDNAASVAPCDGDKYRDDEKEPGVGNILETGLFQTPFGPSVLAGLGPPPWLAYDGSGPGGEEPRRSRVWLWIGIGAAAVTAGVLGVYLSQSSITCPGGADCR
jgi:hypothetical protein